MHVGFLTANDVPNINYRAVAPGHALTRAGHDVELVLQQSDLSIDVARLRRCEIVHVYRRCDPYVRACVEDLLERHIAVTWDNDDDIRLLPPKSWKHLGIDAIGAQRDFRDQAKMMRRADVVTTTSRILADRFRQAGAARVALIENYLHPSQFVSPRRDSGSIVIGWVAGLEHHADAEALGISTVLRRVMARHQNVRVVTIGVRLDLDPARYEHHLVVPMSELASHIRRFDIGIAPLGDIPMSYARSNVKLKEYGAAGVPWLASARGPYLGLGRAEGGLLVEDEQWEESLEALIGSSLKRMRLRRHAKAWAKGQALDRHTDRWIATFEEAIEAAATRRAMSTRPSRAAADRPG